MSSLRAVAAGVDLIDAEFGLPDRSIPLELPLLTGDRTVLIDTGVAHTPSTRIAPALNSHGRAITEIALAVNTHAHEDHIGGNAELRELAPDVQLAIHHRDVGWAQDHAAHFNQTYLSLPGQWEPPPEARAAHGRGCGGTAAIDQYLGPGDVIEVGGGLDLVVIDTHAHSPGHISLYNERHGLLFTGDALQFDGVPVQRGSTIMPYYDDIDDYTAALARIAELKPAALITPHFGVIANVDVHDAVERCLAYVAQLDEAVLATLGGSDRPLQLKTIVAAVHRDRPTWTAGYQLHATTRAHLHRLAAHGIVRAEIDDDVVHWRLAL